MKILKNGICECIYEPRGDHGLEGYQLGEKYRYEFKEKENKRYYKVFIDDKIISSYVIASYGETCGINIFKEHFKIIK